MADIYRVQRQTVVSQFFQLDKLVVEGGKTVGISRCCQEYMTDLLRASKRVQEMALSVRRILGQSNFSFGLFLSSPPTSC